MNWILEGIAMFALIVMFVTIVPQWDQLPDRVPKHFNAAGDPDAWSGKRFLWLLPAIGVAQYLFLTMLSRLDLGGKPLLILLWVKAMMGATFAYITWASVNTALGRMQGLGSWFLPIMLILTLAPVGYYAARTWRTWITRKTS